MKVRTQLFVIFITIVWLANLAPAQDLGSHGPEKKIKTSSHVGLNPGQPDGREGGETIETAFVIPDIPFDDTGNTSDNIDDYEEQCPYGGSNSPDVVYSFTPQNDVTIEVDLCGSGYDTNTYIYDEDRNVVACNDDFYSDDICGQYVSKIEMAELTAGHTYYIVIDGYGSDSGNYTLHVGVPSIIWCYLECSGTEEGEPELQDGYTDTYNTGCNDEVGVFPFQELIGDASEALEFCGLAGWYLSSTGAETRDTDWFIVEIGTTGFIEWTLDSEEPTYGFILGPQDCDEVGVLETMAVHCEPQTLVIEGEPGELVWIWVGSQDFYPPIGYVGQEYTYTCQFSGLGNMGTTSTDGRSFGALKALYR